uniref:Ribosomal protein S6 kinase-like 1 n=1 Tax=Sphaeramia orbicularis TaxID=375764 RepID=A0A673BDR5_9TELE
IVVIKNDDTVIQCFESLLCHLGRLQLCFFFFHSSKIVGTSLDYLVEAAKQIRMALDSEVNEDYEAAFSYYKNGVDLLLNGVQLDPNKERREAVKRKTTQYLKRAEEIFITHLQDNLGKGSGYSSLRFRPIRHLSSPVEDLEMCKVVGVTDKSLVKSSWESREQPTIIPQGVPYMVKLLRYYVSEDAVYLHLEHVKGEPLTLALPLSCARVSQALDVMSELHKTKTGMGLIECSSEFEVAWKAADAEHNCEKINPYAVSDTDLHCTLGQSPPHTNQTSFKNAGSPNSENNGLSSSPAILHLPLHCQTQIHGRASWDTNKEKDPLMKSGGSEGQGEDQIIEVDGWCHLPRFPVKTPRQTDKALQTCWGLPEAEVRVWGAQILLALESLHQQGILCRDLNPRNVLLTSNGKVCLTFFGQWSEVQSEISPKATEQMYCAPEIGGVSKATEACDWWSLGALLFELLTGMPLWQLHPAGIHSHTQLLIPDHLSTAAASLLTELLQFDAGYRLGSGGGGVSDIKCHPFFSAISWKALSC